MTKYLFLPVSVLLLIAPLFVSAATCPNLYRSLSFGMRGQDVVELQSFLIEHDHLAAGNTSGYFGRLTKAAVIDFQSEQGLPATGYVGPLTRAAIARVCASGGTVSTNFSGYPTSGAAPLSVNFSYAHENNDSYTINYGDGNSEAMRHFETPCMPGSKCVGYFGSTHIYSAAGTYTATLSKDHEDCYETQSYPSQMHCSPKVVGTVTISVKGGQTSLSCTSDSQCPSNYYCAARAGTVTSCSSSDPNCQSVTTITDGICTYKGQSEGGRCDTNQDCASDLTCHAYAITASYPGTTLKRCTKTVEKECFPTSGSNAPLCSEGYTCRQGCGPPVMPQYENQSAKYYCVLNENTTFGTMCPICLAGSSLIDTPAGNVQVKDLQKGMPVWTTDSSLNRVAGIVTATSKMPVSNHTVVHVVLSDGRSVFVSAGHPTADGRTVGDLTGRDSYDGATIASVERVPYMEDATYDLLPSGETGYYWANGVLLGSTLK